MKPKYLLDKSDKWLLGEHIPDCDVFFFQVPASSFNSDSSYRFIKNNKKFLGIFRGLVLDFYIGTNDSNEVAESILQALITRPHFGAELDKNIINWSRNLIKFSKLVAKMRLADLTNYKLWQLYQKNDRIHTKLYTYGWLPVAVDLYHNNFTRYLKRYLYTVCDSKEEAEYAFIIFTTPSKKTIVAEEREDFLKIFSKYNTKIGKSSMIDASLRKSLVSHAAKWGHLGYIYAGNVKPFGVDYYYNELRELKISHTNPSRLLKREHTQLVKAKKMQEILFRKIGVDALHRRLFETAQKFALSKLFRRHAQLLNLYIMHQTLLTQIARRLKVTRYQTQFMLADEVREALLNNKINKSELKARLKHCVLYTEKNFEKIYTGKIEHKLIKSAVVKVDKKIKELTGQCAQPGYGKGIVRHIFRSKDVKKMKKGDILVSVATDPDVVPAMKKAAAIVTEQGGITSHAAIVSRELGIPCVIGTKIATKVFKDGDRVEVDATKGIVRKI